MSDILNRKDISKMIAQRLEEKEQELVEMYKKSKDKIAYLFIDDLLPEQIVNELYLNFPEAEELNLKKSLRENKYIGAQMNQYYPLLEECLFAFQEEVVVNKIRSICNLKNIYPDGHLYAGGLSKMEGGQFLNPHLDNSHDKDRNRWRVLNLLFYVTPDWKTNDGGHLELWPEGVKEKPIVIHSKFNRLVIMETHNASWHSVSKVFNNEKSRNCISNYYFSDNPIFETDNFHVTTFRGRPEEKTKNFILRIDSLIRSNLRKIFKKGVHKNKHQYKK